MTPKFFATPARFRAWLERHHRTKKELIVGYYRKSTGKPTITWQESVDEALCFGWIDGIRRRIDDERYCNRFTPRRPSSTWSAINIRRVEALEQQGLMTDAGREAFARRRPEKAQRYSYEQRHEAALDPDQLRQFKTNRKAWAFFEAQAPSYRRTAIYWVASARGEDTRARRLARLIASSAAGKR